MARKPRTAETYHGKPCPKCEGTERYRRNWCCVECEKRRGKKKAVRTEKDPNIAIVKAKDEGKETAVVAFTSLCVTPLPSKTELNPSMPLTMKPQTPTRAKKATSSQTMTAEFAPSRPGFAPNGLRFGSPEMKEWCKDK